MDNKFLEQFYENVILPRYKDTVNFDEITWVDHGKFGLELMGIMYISLITASLSIIGLSMVIVTGGSVKKALHDVISGITF